VSLDPVAAALGPALADACASLVRRGVPFADLREEDLRAELCNELATRMPGCVERERKLALRSFQGVGGSTSWFATDQAAILPPSRS
jgi:hypothetical protein